MNNPLFDLIRKYAEEKGLNATSVEALLTQVADDHKIALKIYDAERLTSSETARTVLDLTLVSAVNVKSTAARAMEIKPGVTLLYGPNDSGKSSLMQAAIYAIGGTKALGSGLDERLIRTGEEEAEVGVKIAGGERYIRRSVSRRVVKKGKDAGQTKIDRELIVKLNGHEEDKLAKAQLEIDTYLGGAPDFVLASAFLRQGLITQMLDAAPGPRREAIYQLLGLESCEETRGKLATVLRQWEGELAEDGRREEAIVKQIEGFRTALKAIPPPEKLQEEIDRLSPVAAGARPQDAALRGSIETRLRAIAGERVMQLDIPADPIDTAEPERVARAARDDHQKKAVELETLRAQWREVYSLPAVCPTCAKLGKTCDLDPAIKARRLADLQALGVQLAKSEEAAKMAAKSASDAYLKAMNDEVERRQLLERKVQLTSERERLVQQFETVPQGATPDPSAVEYLEHCRVKLKEANSYADRIIDLENRLRLIRERSPLEAKAKPAAEVDLLRDVVRMFSKEGIPLWLARGHIGRVNAIAREISAVDRFAYQFGPDLDVQIVRVGTDGMPHVPPALASGSSRERGALVLAAALSRYLQELAGVHVPLLWIDELPFQDPANAQVVVEILKRLTRWFPKVVFAASDWDHYLGQFDHEIALTPEAVSKELDAQRERVETLKAQGQGVLAPPPPSVKTYPTPPPVTVNATILEESITDGKGNVVGTSRPAIPLSTVATPAKDAVDRMVAADPYKAKADAIVQRLTLESAAKKSKAEEELEKELGALELSNYDVPF